MNGTIANPKGVMVDVYTEYKGVVLKNTLKDNPDEIEELLSQYTDHVVACGEAGDPHVARIVLLVTNDHAYTGDNEIWGWLEEHGKRVAENGHAENCGCDTCGSYERMEAGHGTYCQCEECV